jgi:tape measure domain-containing protein
MEGGDLCMSSIDERIVRMRFDNAQFAQGVSSTLKQLEQLKSALKLEGAGQGLNEANAAVGKFSTAHAQDQVSLLGQKFSALQVAAVTALSTIVNKAVNAGTQLAKSLTLDPILSGFREYETNLNSIQTILANTGLKGAEGLSKVTAKLDELNHYADQTIYNFSEMARNIGTFTAAGVSLDIATSAIKGIANLAAISGSNAEQASAAMYQLSQALAAGKVTLEDWNSVVNAGMGGKVFQDALVETARVHGVAVDDIIKKEGSFRLSLQKGWLTSEILTETLSKFTGELTRDQLKSMGYNEQQIAGILEMGRTAVDAATKIKTFTQLIDTLREGVSSGWAKTWQIVFGDFDEAKSLFTEVGTSLGNMVQQSADARNKLLQGWKDLGGRQALIDGLSNAFKALMSVLKPIGDAFRQIFPATTAQQLYNLTTRFRDFMASLKLGSETANNLRRTFAGFFAILGIGWELLKAGVKFIFDLVGSLTGASGGFLKFTGNIGDFLVMLHKAIKEGNAFGKIFEVLGKIIQVPINLIKKLASAISNLFKSADDTSILESISDFGDSLSPLEKLANMVKTAWANVLKVFSKISQKLKELGREFGEWAQGVGEAISGFFSGGLNFDAVLKAVNTGLLAGLFLILKNLFGKIGDFFSGDSGIFEGVINALDGLTGALKGMQNALNATALLAIAAAVGILALALIGLSKIDAAGLTRASIAIAVMFTQLSVAFMAFNRISTGASAIKVGVMAAGLILLATAVNVLASAAKKLGDIPLGELTKGLIGVAVLLGALAGATRLMDTATPGMFRTAAGLVVLAVAVRMLVSSVQELGGMDWESLAKGLVGVGTLLGALALFTKFVAADKAGLTQGIGIILLATGLKVLASAVQDFTKFNWEQLARGMAGVAVGLGLIVGALNLIPPGTIIKAAGLLIVTASLQLIADGVGKMASLSWGEIGRGLTVLAASLILISLAIGLLPPTSLVSAAGILVVAVALQILASAMKKMGGMSWEEIAKSLVVLAGSLIIISAALVVASGTLAGSAAILIMSVALSMLAPVLVQLGAMSWSDIAAGLAALAGVFLVIGVAGLVLGPIVPIIAALAISIGILGIAMLAAGVGVLAFATGLTILGAAGGAATAAIVGIVKGLVGLIPYVMEQIGLGLVAFAKVIATSGPAILQALTTVLDSLLDAVIKLTPKIVKALQTMLHQLLDAMVESVPKMVDAGLKITRGVMKGIADNLPGIIDQGTRIVVAFLDGIGRNLGRVVQAGVDLIFKFIAAVTDAIRNSGGRLADAGWDMAKAIIDGVANGLRSLAGRAMEAARSMAKNMLNAALGILGIASPSKEFAWIGKMVVLGLEKGLNDHANNAVKATESMGSDVIDSMGKTLSGLSKVLGKDLIDFDPTITPVLDLSQIKKDATQITDLLTLRKMDLTSVQRRARDAAAGYESNRTDEDELEPTANSGKSYSFTQNNYSPKALDPIEIYRQSDNLISRTKKGEN